MELSNFIEGLKTLQPYYDNPDGFHIGAEHDEFYAYATDRTLPETAVNRMVELGWFQHVHVPDGGDFDSSHYQAEEGWCAYT